jgi:large subunit ribosomal protein L22
MGSRKQTTALKRKEEKKSKYYAIMRDCPTSPRKMRLVADMVRGTEVKRALDLLKFSSKEASRKVENLFFQLLPTGKTKMRGNALKMQTW